MNNIILFCIIISILGGAIWYIISEKKKGRPCIGCSCGCPHADNKQKMTSCACGCAENSCSCHNKN